MKKVLLALVVFNAILFTEIILYSQNTFIHHSDWRISKRELYAGVMGADPFLITRPPLAQNKLHLGAWYGFQEIKHTETLTIQKISYRFKLEKESYINLIIYRPGNREAFGIRLSANEHHPSMFFSLSKLGEFTAKSQFDTNLDSNWHNAIIEFNKSSATLEIDGIESGRIAFEPEMIGQVSLRSGIHPTMIDDVSIIEVNGEKHLETFQNRENYFELFILNLFASAFLILFLYFFKLRKKSERTNTISHVAFMASMMSCAAIYFYFDYYHWSNFQFENLTRPIQTESKQLNKSNFEQARHTITSFWYKVGGGTIVNSASIGRLNYRQDRVSSGPFFCEDIKPCILLPSYLVEKKRQPLSREFRIVIIGTSQTFGAGASELTQTLTAQLHKRIAKKISPQRKLMTLNISKSGSRASVLFDDYYRIYSDFNPNLIVINLGNNDTESDLSSNLTHFLEYCKKNAIQVVLLKEPNTTEKNLNYIYYKHNIIEKLGKDFNFPVYNAHGFFQSESIKDSGLLWWDNVHLTDFGQHIFAEWLSDIMWNDLRL